MGGAAIHLGYEKSGLVDVKVVSNRSLLCVANADD